MSHLPINKYVIKTKDGYYTTKTSSERTNFAMDAKRLSFPSAMRIMRDIGANPDDVITAPRQIRYCK